MEGTFSLNDLIMLMLRRWKLIVSITMIAVIASAGITYFYLTPVYKASTQILVNQKDADIQVDVMQLRNHIELINTYSVIIKTPAILDKVIDNLGLPYTADQLNQSISVNRDANSVVFSIAVKDSNPGRAVEIANAVAETFQQEIKEIMNIDNVNILAKAELKKNPMPVSPQPKLNIAVAIVFGLLVGVGLAFLIEYLDNTLKNGKDVESYLGLPVLGSVQNIRTNREMKDYTIKRIGVETVES